MTAAFDELWDPNDWEAYSYGLLQDRHGPLNVQKVPARHKGDQGLDYYCLGEGVVYQCYAVQEPCDVAARAANQIKKATTDLKKFCSDSKALNALFGGKPIRKWVLLVPLHDSSSVNQHLAKKTTELRAANLKYVAGDIEVIVQDIGAFDTTSIEHRRRQASEFTFATRLPSAADVENWSESQNDLVRNLIRKLQKRVAGSATADADRFIGWFLERENTLEDLRETAPQLHEAVRKIVSRLTTRLEFAGPPDGKPPQVLRDTLEELANTLRSEIPNLSAEGAERMALGTVADWLLRCPLDYPPFENAS